MKLLTAIDSSPYSEQVLDEIARRPWPLDTTVCVLHVIDWPQLPSSGSWIQALKHSADLLVESAAKRLCKAGLPTTTKVMEGHPRIAVSDYAREWRADFVLVGSHGASGLARFLLGSVAQAVLRRSPCSVEIVRRTAQESAPISSGMKILVATDGSDCSMVAVSSVASRPWPSGSRVRLISVIPVILAVGAFHPIPPVYLPGDVFETLQTQARSRAEEAVERATQILREAHMEPVKTGFLPIGDARQVILEEAKDWGADLIVVGSHGYNGIDRLMLGSVSESVAMHAHCSVEVIRETQLTARKEAS
jgi:nucleotide-binding universal stress UspA family protein